MIFPIHFIHFAHSVVATHRNDDEMDSRLRGNDKS